jgi:hypothetical protein
MKRSSTRFRETVWTRYLVPVMLVSLLLALVLTVIFVILFAAGII